MLEGNLGELLFHALGGIRARGRRPRGGKCAPNGAVLGLESPMPDSPALAITVSVSVPLQEATWSSYSFGAYLHRYTFYGTAYRYLARGAHRQMLPPHRLRSSLLP